jgi:tetratricopeptide (TPR) repeat protein
MKTMTAMGAALVGAVLAAAPAFAAQYGGSYGSASPTHQGITAPQAQQQQTAQPTGVPSVKPSAKAVKALIDLQNAVDKKDYANIPAKVAAAQAVATTKEDQYLLADLQLRAAIGANDNAAMASAIDAIAASNYLEQPKIAQLYAQLGGTLLKAKQFAQAAAAYQKSAAIDPSNTETQRLLGISLFEQGQKSEALTALQKAIQASTAAGQKPDEDTFRLAVQAAYDSKLPAASDLAREWVQAYPSSDSWYNAVTIYRNLAKPDEEATLDLLRLLRTVGALKASEYAVYAATAADELNFTEAQSVLDQGLTERAISATDPDMREIIATLKTKPKATEAGLAEATTMAKESLPVVRIGDRYAAMDEYEKAESAYHLALTKPGADASLVNLHLGMALARKGDKAGATSAFNAVSGPLSGVAKYWLVYLATKG